jgi:hypothetical protein
MSNRIYLTNAHYDLPNDEFSCEIKAEIDGTTIALGGIYAGPEGDGEHSTVRVDVPEAHLVQIIRAMPVLSALHLTALATMALHNALGDEDSTYADTLDRGDIIVLQS